MKKTVTFQGSELHLAGEQPSVGDKAPDFTVLTQDMKEVTLKTFSGKTKLITTFPSLDTPICDLQVKQFEKSAAEFPADVVVIGISKDLPFAQSRFCKEYAIKKIKVYSDYMTSSFGMAYGLLIQELNLLARAVVILDKDDIIRYWQIADEITHHLDYDDAVKQLLLING